MCAIMGFRFATSWKFMPAGLGEPTVTRYIVMAGLMHPSSLYDLYSHGETPEWLIAAELMCSQIVSFIVATAYTIRLADQDMVNALLADKL